MYFLKVFYATLYHVPLLCVDAKFVRWPSSTHVAVSHRRPLLPPQNLAHPPNIGKYFLSLPVIVFSIIIIIAIIIIIIII